MMVTKVNNFPIIIGGSGGSGTRVVAEILIKSGVYLGQDLNISNDNLLFTYLFKHPDNYSKDLRKNDSRINKLFKLHEKIFLGTFPKRITELIFFLKASIEHIYVFRYYKINWVFKRWLNLIKSKSVTPRKWGWKEPHTGFFLHSIYSFYPNCKYILVLRDGLDMAYSKNDQQLKFWNTYFNIDSKDLSPRNKFEYWYQYNKYIINNAKELFGDNFLIIRLEDLCLNKENNIKKLLNFIGVDIQNIPQEILSLPKLPKSYKRYLNHNTKWIDDEVKKKLNELNSLR